MDELLCLYIDNKIAKKETEKLTFTDGKTDFHSKIKETMFIQELKPSLNVNISSEKLLLF